MVNPGNKGEWAEIYIFLKLVSEGKVYMADEKMQRLANVYLKILKILREENPGERLEYVINDPVTITMNDINIGPDTPVSDFIYYMEKTWTMIESATAGNGLFDEDIAKFLEKIHINKLKAPAQSSANYFGGTEDIVMHVEDYRSGIDSIMGFSCKSQFTAEATLFNASGDNTNFRYRIIGNINDDVMNEVNNIFRTTNKTNKKTGMKELKYDVAISERMKCLKDKGCDLEFIQPCVSTAKRNLIQSGGLEMPAIIGEMLKYYYFRNNGESDYSNISKVIRYLADTDPIHYNVDDLAGMYKSKVGKLLYDMFTGMRMATVWSGRQTVTGGYICAKKDGDVVAFHANVADEFRDFLVNQLAFESPSADRHNYMKIEKDGDGYFINFNMQFRFTKSEMVKLEILGDKLSGQKMKLNEKYVKAVQALEKKRSSNNSESISKAQAKVEELEKDIDNKEKEIKENDSKKQQVLDGQGNF